jgi:mono/diheme cytochrome c family protein
MRIRSWLFTCVALASQTFGCTSTSAPKSAAATAGAGGAHASTSGSKTSDAAVADPSTAGKGGTAAAAMAPSGAAGWQAFMDTTPATLGSAERGQYLVDHVLVCGVCHTPSLPSGEADTKNYLAGSRPYDFTDIDGTVITVNAENLTSHDPEGLHAWTDGQIRTAITKGVDDEHYAIYPIMPYPEYALLELADVDSIIKYLRTVPPNDNVVAADYPRPDIHPPAVLVDGSKVPHTTLAKSDPDYDAAERGRYIASVACLNCHTEEVVLPDGMIDHDEPNLAKAFAGGKQYTFEHLQPKHTSLNITPDATGLAGWTVDDIVQTLKNNQEKGQGRAFCNTHPGEAYKQMAEADMHDVAVYIHSLPPIKNGPFQCKPQ